MWCRPGRRPGCCRTMQEVLRVLFANYKAAWLQPGKTRTCEFRNGSYVSWGSQNKLGLRVRPQLTAAASYGRVCGKEGGWGGGGVILWLNKATAELTERKKEDQGISTRLRWLQELIRREFKHRHRLLCRSTERLPPPLKNGQKVTTEMFKFTLVQHVFHWISRLWEN